MYKYKVPKKCLSDLSSKQDFKGVVGRDIKALVKLAKMYSQGKDKKLTLDSFYEIQGFVPNVSKNIELN